MPRTAPEAVLSARRGGRRSPRLRVWRVPSPPAAAPAELSPRLTPGRPRPTPPQRARPRRVRAALACWTAVDSSGSCGPLAQDSDRRTPFSGARARWQRPARAPRPPIPAREGGVVGASRPGLVSGFEPDSWATPRRQLLQGYVRTRATHRKGYRSCASAKLMVVCRAECHLSVCLFSLSTRLAIRRFEHDQRASVLSSGLTAALMLMASPDGDC